MSILNIFRSSKKSFAALTFCGIIMMLLVRKYYPEPHSVQTFLGYPTANGPTSGYVTIGRFKGRLGNQMFMFGSLFYVAMVTKREVILFRNHNAGELQKYFSLGVRKINRSCPCFTWHQRRISFDVRLKEETNSQNATNSQTLILHGWFQSWKYFEPVQHQIRTAMKFRNDIEAFARDFLRETIPRGWTEGRFTRVGIHNRRGDFTGLRSDGFTMAPETYFLKAMKYFADRHKLVQFIVASDDTKWSQQHITYDSQTSSVNVTYLLKHSPGQDMAILSLCDHMIISSGSFGWLAAWYGHGDVVYYSDFPRKGSRIAKLINASDYYPPHWIPMD